MLYTRTYACYFKWGRTGNTGDGVNANDERIVHLRFEALSMQFADIYTNATATDANRASSLRMWSFVKWILGGMQVVALVGNLARA